MTQPWPEVRLGDIAHFKNGLNYSKQDFGHGLKVIGVGDFGNRSRFSNFEGLAEIDPAKMGGSIPTLRNGDVLFVRSNGNRELIGRSATVRGLTEQVSFSGFTIRCRFYSDLALSDYFSFLFRGHVVRDVLSSFGGGTNINNLNQEILTNLKVPLPPLPIQHKIVAILSTYDDLIENNTRRVQVLEQMARDLYREWFVEFRFPGHGTVKFVEDERGRRPEGWKRGVLSDVLLNFRTSLKPGANTAVLPYVPIDELSSGSLGLQSYRQGEDAQSSLIGFKKGDLIFGAMRSYLKKASIAPFNGVTRTTCFVLRPRNHFGKYFGYLLATSMDGFDYASKGARGTTIPYAVWDGSFANMPVLIPDDTLLGLFDNICSPLFGQVATSIFRQHNLRRTRDLLLPKLVSGELNVSALDVRGPGLEPTDVLEQTPDAVA